MQEKISLALKAAQSEDDKCRLATLRLVQAAIRDRDTAAREHGGDGVKDAEVLEILQKMICQREVSARDYEETGQLELAEKERREVDVIREFLPIQIDQQHMKALCAETVNDLGAQGLRDMGRCMNELKERYPGQMDFAKASSVIQELLRSE